MNRSAPTKSGGKQPKTPRPAEGYDTDEQDREYRRQRELMSGPKRTVNEKEMEAIDFSITKDTGLSQEDIEAKKREFLDGEDEDLRKLGFYDSDDEIDFSNFKGGEEKNDVVKEEADRAYSASLFGKLATAFKNITGNKVLTKADLEPVLKDFSENLTNKNVSSEIAQKICKQVEDSLVDTKTASFTSIKQTAQEALVDAIQKLLTPKRNIDILKEALSAKKKGQVYSMVFIGVNGVGKSTSLAKTAYYLKSKGNLKVMLAGCDNFRSGAIEQLQTHASCLDVPLY
mmetsp:Transcript_24242/g.37376  ORF Transcript_24242/g.37376 Transcript_24242/m.37376 type:complete len:286 (+) Transcript_24242:599-1456(+)